jgi:O-antigen ligase
VTISANSRGGILSSVSLCAFAVFTHFLTKNRDSEGETKRNLRAIAPSSSPFHAVRFKTILTGLFFSVLLCGVSIFIVAFIGGEAVANRMETIQTEMEASDSKKVRRHEIWQSTINLIKDYPATGIGFGAYGTAITGYDQATGRFVLQQAHNDYLEILANGGVTAFALALTFLIILFKRIYKQFASASAFRRASCFGAIAGIIGVMLHSTVDFGLHVIVNALVFIILIVIATAKIAVESDLIVQKLARR